ncbi:Glutamyl-tRNA amidotransferase subunit A, mitochondrial [Choiromyces venosus 120613-1]|uniref:Glutamyl-tRNA(Gln) amidotransferase subunit A, mitochondrial n=1 Tax=Choiromyces venosus 120613-1 TaxID=1336337 RepID=A0A3N4JVT9_9PEZI|nr:Glutamyl-tRNA amidotransferase subunit A, mitochondrial [Choiromyces venosus 120613-1]
MVLLEVAKKSLLAAEKHLALNALISVQSRPELFSQVQASQERISAGESKSPIDGQLIAVKDNICTTDFPTTCASKLLEQYISPFDATVVRKAKEAGAVIMGKTNMDEFGMGSHSMYSHFGSVMQPAEDGQPARSAGGSSGGSAVAVATGMCHAALGTDTGGSVRLPAAYCGVVGFKPSYGMLSRWGVIAYANSLDTVGILGRRISSVQKLYDAINGYDDNDPTSITPQTRERVQDRLSRNRRRGQGLTIGYPEEFNLVELDDSVRNTWEKTLAHLNLQSHKVVPVSLPHTKHALSAYYVLAPAEASSNLAKYDGVRYGYRDPADRLQDGLLFSPTRANFGAEVRRRIIAGAYSLSSEAIDNYFLKAQSARRIIQRDFSNVFAQPNYLITDTPEEGRGGEGVDVLIAPCALSKAPFLEDVKMQKSPLDSYVNDVLTVPASLAGIPAICLPVMHGENDSVGMQVMAQYGDEETMWEVAKLIEEGLGPKAD